MIGKRFERYLLLLIVTTLLTSVLVVVFSSFPASASLTQEEPTRLSAETLSEEDRGPEDHRRLSTETWTQETQADFEGGDITDLDTESSPGELMLETYEFQVGAAESPDSDWYWNPGWTLFPGREDYHIDRGGEIVEFTAAVGERASAFKLKILRPTQESDEFFAAETEVFDPDSWTIKTWDLSDEPIPVQEDDRMGQYTLGELSAWQDTGQNGRYYYEGEITSTPRTMEWESVDTITTIEAQVETHEDSGTLVSSVYETGPGMYDLGTISWDSDEPSGSELTIETRTSPDASEWSSWEEAADGGEVESPVDRYIQYRATFETSDGQHTPVLDRVSIDYHVDTYPPEIEVVESVEGWQAEGPYTVRAEVTDDYSGVDQDSVEMRYRVDGGTWESVPMSSTGGDGYSGEIPDQAHDTVVEYYIYAEDIAGNEERSIEYSFQVDKDPPETSVTLEGEGDGPYDGWYRGEVQIEFTAQDQHSGVVRIWYKINDRYWEEIEGTEGSTTVEGSGSHEVSFYSEDNVGNEETEKQEDFKIDDTRPESEVTIEGKEGEDGWYIGEVEVFFNADDEFSGVDSIQYRLGDGHGWEDIEGDSGSVSLDESGTHEIEYKSVDNVGNEETTTSVEVKIDLESPSIDLIKPEPGGENDWYVEEPSITIIAEDGISKISHISYRISNETGEGDWVTVEVENEEVEMKEVEIKLEDGEHTLEYLTQNGAGLKSAEEEDADSSHLKVDTLEPWIDYDISEPEDTGWYTSPPEVSISVDDRGGSRIEMIEYRLGEDGDWRSYQKSFEIDKEGDFYLGIRAQDEAGHLNEKESVRRLNIDLTPPSLSDIQTSDTVWRNEMTVTVSVSAGESSLETVILRYKGSDGWVEEEMEEENGEYRYTISGSDVGFSDVDYQIIAEDEAGNEFESETKVGDVGINWWYLLPIPIAIVLIAGLVYWKRHKEEEEKLLPVKDSKISKIKKGKERKLGDMDRGTRSGMTTVGGLGAASTSDTGGEKCDKCGGPIDPEKLLRCSCGETYHDDCLRIRGVCSNCGKDYAAVTSFSPDQKSSVDRKKEATEISEKKPKGPPAKPPKEPEDELEAQDTEKPLKGDKKGSEGPEIWSDDTDPESKRKVKKKVKKAKKKVKKKDSKPAEGKEEDHADGPRSDEEEDEIFAKNGETECPVCGNKNEVDAEVCWACHADLIEE